MNDVQTEQQRIHPPPTPPGVATPRQMELMKRWVIDIGVAVIVSLIIITFFYQPVRVQGTSMQPRLVDQDRLLVSKSAYRFGVGPLSFATGTLRHGDVVVFYYPADQTKSYIKRVIGLPGDDVRIEHGVVYVNGNKIPEPYVPQIYQDERSVDDLIVPEGNIYVLGDHRNISSDSREFGPVSSKLIYGRAAFVFWPVKDSGTVR